MTIKEAYIKYLDYATLKLKPQSVRAVSSRFESYILPYFSELDINQLTADKYLLWQKEINGKNFSYKYKKSLHYSMVALFNYLITFDFIKTNIPKQIGNFKNIEPPKCYQVWSYSDFKKFRKFVDENVYKVLFDFLFFTGCRLGETLALTFNDINGNYITIDKTISKESFDGKRIINSPKTKKSIRKVQIDNQLKYELIELKKYYSTQYDDFSNNFFVFGGPKPLAPTTIERKKNKYCKLAGVNQIRLHDFRHSHASILLSKGLNIKVISERLGHDGINTTFSIYTHIYPKDEKRVINTLNLIRLNEFVKQRTAKMNLIFSRFI